MSKSLSGERLAEIRKNVLDEAADLPTSIDRYEILGELGRGGMGIVYHGYDPSLQRAVAVKVIRSDRLTSSTNGESAAKRFEKEMRATSEIFHPNIVAILDAGIILEEAQASPYFVMEYIEGESLEMRIKRKGKLDRAEGLALATAIAEGLAAAHEMNLIHRDLKPANILLPSSENGEQCLAKISDFGLCRFRNDLESLTSAKSILGSANYIAPEQIQSDPVSSSADLFSLGAILVRMFSGVEPFHAENIPAHLYRILHDDPDGLEGMDDDIREAALKLLAKNPADRPSSARETALWLGQLAQEPSRPPSKNEQTPPTRKTQPDETPSTREGGGNRPTPSVSGGRRPFPRQRGMLFALLIGLVAAVCSVGTWAHNELVAHESATQVQWKQVENQLVRQHELLPKLVEITNRYAKHENEIFASIGSGIVMQTDLDSKEQLEADSTTLRRIHLLAGQLPSLRADEQFMALSFEVTGTKNRLAIERMRYNEAVGNLNQRLKQFPWRWFALGIEPRDFFNPTEEQMTDPPLGL